MDADPIRKLILASALLIAKAAKIGREALADIHCKDVLFMSLIRLHTIEAGQLKPFFRGISTILATDDHLPSDCALLLRMLTVILGRKLNTFV